LIDNLESTVYLRYDSKGSPKSKSEQELQELIRIAEIMSRKGHEFSDDKSWRTLQQQILFKIRQFDGQIPVAYMSALSYAVVKRYPRPVDKNLRKLVEHKLLEHV
jgi:hypothetical protein